MCIGKGSKTAPIIQYGAGPRHPKTGHVGNLSNLFLIKDPKSSLHANF